MTDRLVIKAAASTYVVFLLIGGTPLALSAMFLVSDRDWNSASVTGLAVLFLLYWIYWVSRFRITITESSLDYRQAFAPEVTIPMTEVEQVERWPPAPKPPRGITIIAKGRVVRINAKVFGRVELVNLLEALDSAQTAGTMPIVTDSSARS